MQPIAGFGYRPTLSGITRAVLLQWRHGITVFLLCEDANLFRCDGTKTLDTETDTGSTLRHRHTSDTRTLGQSPRISD